ncbi:hypothetical protein SCORR_v1c09550 [Spiroplasma corruscae]|uniref:Uncharacterized protein n=1 Tax=Spiroplasma corruscae TaxID=216934 RepID=A0A222EQE6_9MOLU|nr:hypothetical protein [Spiroplasma corruscae]ASP28727.1 hypothetical protein SCORR_v1c09550 [Spiroplasma corruscae]
MKNNIKPLNHEKIIINRVDVFYKNLKENIRNSFEVPKVVLDFFEDFPAINSIKEVERFGECVNSSIKEWKPINNENEIIIINYILSIIKNAMVVILSINTNLKKEGLEKNTIKTKKGVDVMISTAVQAIGVKFSDLTFKYNELMMEKDSQEVFKNFNLWLNTVIEQDSMLAFSMLIDNIFSFIDNYKKLNNKITSIKEDEFNNSRVTLFLDYIETYYLLVLILELVLTYPLNEGLMNETTFINMLPNINLFN